MIISKRKDTKRRRRRGEAVNLCISAPLPLCIENFTILLMSLLQKAIKATAESRGTRRFAEFLS